MASYTYVLRYGSVSRYIDSEFGISSGNVVRIIKPADDRDAADDFRISDGDLVPMVVDDYTIEYHEGPNGGLKKVTVLYLRPPRDGG